MDMYAAGANNMGFLNSIDCFLVLILLIWSTISTEFGVITGDVISVWLQPNKTPEIVLCIAIIEQATRE